MNFKFCIQCYILLILNFDLIFNFLFILTKIISDFDCADCVNKQKRNNLQSLQYFYKLLIYIQTRKVLFWIWKRNQAWKFVRIYFASCLLKGFWHSCMSINIDSIYKTKWKKKGFLPTEIMIVSFLILIVKHRLLICKLLTKLRSLTGDNWITIWGMFQPILVGLDLLFSQTRHS